MSIRFRCASSLRTPLFIYVEKVKLIVFPRAYILMKQARKPFIVGTNYQHTINTGTLVSYLISSCGNNHYISLVVQILSYVMVSMAK